MVVIRSMLTCTATAAVSSRSLQQRQHNTTTADNHHTRFFPHQEFIRTEKKGGCVCVYVCECVCLGKRF